MPDEVERLGRELGDRLGRLYSIAPLASGSSGRSFLLLTESGRFVAKRFGPGPMTLLGPCAQAGLLERLAAAGIAPRAALADDDAGLLVTEYIADARALTAARLREPAHIDALALLLRQLHGIDADIPAYRPLDYAERYLEQAGGIAELGRSNRLRYAELLALAAVPLPGASVICHNDLTADHLLFGPAPKLIDFDYAAKAAPILDLASAVVMNALGAREAMHLLAAYFGGPAPFDLAEFARVQRLQRLLAHFWALAVRDRVPAIVDEYRIHDD